MGILQDLLDRVSKAPPVTERQHQQEHIRQEAIRRGEVPTVDRAKTKAPYNKAKRRTRARIAEASRAVNRRPKNHRRHRVHSKKVAA